jgi:hypothetical protein
MARPGSPQVTPGEVIAMSSGAVALVASFLPWYRVVGGGTVSAWAPGLFPLATLLALAGIVTAVQVALDRLARVSMPRRLGDFTWEQIYFVLAGLAVLVAVSYLIVDKVAVSFGAGFYLELLAAFGLLIGAVMIRKERRLSAS